MKRRGQGEGRTARRCVTSLILMIASGLVAAGCQAAAPVEPVTAALLAEHGLQADGATTTASVEIGAADGPPWPLYLEASRQIDLDFSPYEGRQAEVRTTPLSRPGLRVHVLVLEGEAVGAWLSADNQAPGLYPLSQPPAQ